ncbi:MAG: ZIP family metal transporter [Candidatus Odinarchaeota archaeon]|nr:ZIP family metal transporter [Candidatus Odinarchaeota archaeon]
MGNFGILVYGGFSNFKALLFNFLSALTAVISGIVGVLLGSMIVGLEGTFLAFVAGGFIYVAGSNLVPELHKEHSLKKTVIQVVFVLVGVLIMWFIA